MKLVDVTVTREQWFPLCNQGICARVAGPAFEDIRALLQWADANPDAAQKVAMRIWNASD